MPENTPASWQPDPYGRFAQRYWDGANWTENVVDPSGAPATDPPFASAAPAPPAAPPPPAPPAPPAYGMSPPTTSALPVPGLIVVGIGALLLLLSDFALTWFSNRGLDVNLSDLRNLASESNDVPFFVDQYLTWGWLLGLAAVALAVVALFVPGVRIVALVATVAVAVWHAWAVYDTGSDRISPEIGAWVGAVGLALCAVAVVLPRKMSVARAT